MNRKNLYLIVAIVLISTVAAVAVNAMDNGLAIRSASETTDSLPAMNIIAHDENNNPPRLPEVNYSWDPNQEYYVPDQMNGHIYGKVEIDIPGNTEIELRTAVKLLNPSSWALVEYITIELKGSSSLGLVTLYHYSNGNTSGNPVDTALVTTGVYDFHIHVKYRAAIRMDPTNLDGKEMQSDIIFTLEKKYVTVNYSINAGTNGSTAGEMPTQKITKMKSKLNLNTFTYTGFAFAGWSKTDGTTVDYMDGATIDVSSLIDAGTTVLNLKAVWKTDGLYNETEKALYATSNKVRTDTTDGIYSGHIYYVGKNTDIVIKGSDVENGISNVPILILLRDNVTVNLTYPENPASDSAMVCFFNVESVIGDKYVLNSTSGLGDKWYDGSTKIIKEQTSSVEYYSLEDGEKAKWGQWTYEAYKSNKDDGQTVNVKAESSKVINVGSNKDMVFTKSQYDIKGTWARIGAYSGKTVTFLMDGFTGIVSSGEGGSTLPIKDEIALTGFVGTVEVKSNNYVKITEWTSGSALVENGSVTLGTELGTHDLKYRVTFTVTDGSQPVKGVSVTLDDNTLVTDSEGKAKFASVNKAVEYTVSKLGYNTISGSIEINNTAHEKPITLTPSLMYYNVEEKTLYATTGEGINQIKHNQSDLIPGSIYYFNADMGSTISTISSINNGTDKPILVLVEEGVTVNVMFDPDASTLSNNTISVCFYTVERSSINDNVYTFTKGLGTSWYDNSTCIVKYSMSDDMIVNYHSMTDALMATWGEWVYEPYQAYGDKGQIVYVRADSLRGILNVGTNTDMIYSKSIYYMTGNWQRIGAVDGKSVEFTMDGFTGTASSGQDTGSLGKKDEIGLKDFVGTVVIRSNANVTITNWISGTVTVMEGSLNISDLVIKTDSLRTNVSCIVKDGDVALEGATVNIGGVSGTTNNEGKATIAAPYGGHQTITVSAAGKSTYESTVDVVLAAKALEDIVLHADGNYDSENKKLYVSADKVIKDTTGPIQSGHIYYFTQNNGSVSISATNGGQDKPILVLLKEGIRVGVTYPSDAEANNSAMVCFFSVKGNEKDEFTFTNGLGSKWYNESMLKDLTGIGRINYYELQNDELRNAWGEWVYEPYQVNGDNGQTVYAEASTAFHKVVVAGGNANEDLVFTRNSYDMTGTYGRIGAYSGRTISFSMSVFTGTVSSGAGSGELPIQDEVFLVNFTGTLTVVGGTSITINTWEAGDLVILKGSLTGASPTVPAGSNSLNMNVGTALDANIGWMKTHLYNEYDQQEHTLTNVEKGYYYVDLGVAKNVQSIKINLTTYTADSTFRLSIGNNSFVTDKVYYISENHLYVATVFVGLYPSLEINESGVQLPYSTTPVTTELTSTIGVYKQVSGFNVGDPEDSQHYDKKLTLPRTNGGDHGSVSIVPNTALGSDSVILCKINYDYSLAPIESYAFTTTDSYNEGYCIALYILYGKDLSAGAYSGSHLSFTYYVMGAGYDTLNFELAVVAPSP
jgi:hypothetical protein